MEWTSRYCRCRRGPCANTFGQFSPHDSFPQQSISPRSQFSKSRRRSRPPPRLSALFTNVHPLAPTTARHGRRILGGRLHGFGPRFAEIRAGTGHGPRCRQCPKGGRLGSGYSRLSLAIGFSQRTAAAQVRWD